MTRLRSRSARVPVAAQAVLFVVLSIQSTLVASQTSPAPTLRNVRLTQSGEVWTIVVEADGALSQPKIGELDGPPRVYIDFEGVRTSVTSVAAEPGAPVVRVRAAVHSRTPLVTRVVVDLASKQPIRTETEHLQSGRFKILIGTVTSTEPQSEPAPAANPVAVLPAVELPPVPAAATTSGSSSAPSSASAPVASNPVLAPPPHAPEISPASSAPGITPVPARSTTRPVPPKDAERYLEQIAGALGSYRRLQPTLVSIDSRDPTPPAGLGQVREELAAILRALTALHPPDSAEPVHDVLLRSVSFALMAATLRQDAGTRADPEKMRNAASAAAGALLLLQRACTELGCPAPQGSK